MFKMSGVAVVMAGLAGTGLLYAAWSWDTTPLRAMTKQSLPALEAPADAGNTLVLHSGAWRIPPAENAPPAVAASGPSAGLSLSISPQAVDLPAPAGMVLDTGQGMLFSRSLQGAPVAPHPKAAPPTPAAQPVATEIPAPHDRMSLAGPRTAHSDRPQAAEAGRQPPRPFPSPEPEPQATSAPKFGPEAVKKLDNNGY